MELIFPRHEDRVTEFKAYFNARAVAMTVCAFANTLGGHIFIGRDEHGLPILKAPFPFGPESTAELLEEKVLAYLDNFRASRLSYNSKDQYFSVTPPVPEDGLCALRIKPRTAHDEESHEKAHSTVFLRLGAKNMWAPTDELARKRLIEHIRTDFPKVSQYVPSQKEKREEMELLLKENDLEFLEMDPIPGNQFFYKYMDLESFLLSLGEMKPNRSALPCNGHTLRFVEPAYWDDIYEGRFYNAEYLHNGKASKLTPPVWAACFTTKSENEAAWAIYSHGRSGLASRCIQLRLNRSKLREQLVRAASRGDDGDKLKGAKIYVGMVNYKDKHFIDNLHKDPHSKDYKTYFENFSIDKYINLLRLKRPAFEHEREVRFFIVPKNHNAQKSFRKRNEGMKLEKKNRPIFIPIDWFEIIENIKIDCNVSDYERDMVRKATEELVNRKKATLKPEEFERWHKYHLEKFDPYASQETDPLTIIL